MKEIVVTCFISFVSLIAFGQKEISPGDKLVFVYYENRPHNLIAIPNMGKLYSFKIYRKQTGDTTFQFIIEKKRPLLPMRYNMTQYGVTWEDIGYHSKDVDYKVIAFDKAGKELCIMNVMWHNASDKQSQ